MKDEIFIKDYNYNLPDERIAKYPLVRRDKSKLLLYRDSQIEENTFNRITTFLPQNALLIYNNTRVIQARMKFYKSTGARIEIFCLEPLIPSSFELSLSATKSCQWRCMVGNLKKWKIETLLHSSFRWRDSEITLTVSRKETDGDTHIIHFSWDSTDITFSEILMVIGELPIPPYLHRKTENSDKQTYQTVYAKTDGSVAAPTAGLHFTQEVLDSLKTKNIMTDEVTLHVGAGTFKPVKTESISAHEMHTETIIIRKSTLENILQKVGNIVAVGTTSVRTLESLYYIGCLLAKGETGMKITQWLPYQHSFTETPVGAIRHIIDYLDTTRTDYIVAETQIIITPGYQFKMVNAMVTNFHQPQSTLLLLISAFVGEDWHKIYDYALQHNFRFLSYGDSSLLFPKR